MPVSEHSNATGLELHEDKRIKIPVRAASTTSVTLATPGASLDGVTLSSGDRILLKNQSTQSQNGIYTWAGSATTLARATDADAAADFVHGFLVYVREGTVNAGTYWSFTQSAAVTLGTTAIAFAALTSSGAFAGEVSGTAFRPSGLTGATAISGYVGATTGGPPTSGTFAIGDFVESRADGAFWTCITAGTPGTWKKLDANPMTAVGDIIIGGTVANGIAATARLAAGATAGHVVTSNGAGVAPSYQSPHAPYVNIQDQKSSGTAGGGFTSGAWQTRTLQTEVSDDASIATLASNQITLAAGTYEMRAAATAAAVDRHQLRLQNVTDTTTTVGPGLNSVALAAGPDQTTAILAGRFTIAASKALELQHRCQTTRATDGFGFSASWGTEVYAMVEFWKVG